MKEKMLTRNVVEAVYTVLGERQVKAVDMDCCTMNGIEYTIADELAEDYIQYILHKYNNTIVYKRDKVQYIAIFPRSINLLYNN